MNRLIVLINLTQLKGPSAVPEADRTEVVGQICCLRAAERPNLAYLSPTWRDFEFKWLY